ncbi:glycosyltransferase [Tenacibaculum maritimum]|nr:glycosyltransferase [Tenacibaculum maritimum]MDB0611623.1 glycosyltransferase [Tenacibaculum maritimum]
MKLAIITAYPPSKVTLNEYAYHLVKSFHQNKKITELILLTDKTSKQREVDFSEKGCKITVMECWKFNSYLNIFTITRAIQKSSPDAVLFNLQFMKFGDKKIPAALGLILPWVSKLRGVPTIVLLHNILEQVDLNKAGFTSNQLAKKIYATIGTLLTRLILKADIVAVTMQKYVKILVEKYQTCNVVKIPHGTFEITQEEPDYNLVTDPLQIMAFGKFGTYKKVEIMIEAVLRVRETTGLNLEIVIAGTDNPNVIGYLAGVQEKYKDVSQIRFTGYVEEEEVPILFKESTVVVFPYTSTTGSSGVLHQAGSYGKAVVMPDLGDLALLVQDEGYQGEFFEPNSVVSLAKAIEALVTDEAYRLKIAKANYKAATAFPMERIAAMYINEFEKIMISKAKILKKNAS